MRHLKKVNSPKGCLFCTKGEDSLEHFSKCHFCRDVFEKASLPFGSLELFLGLHTDFANTNLLVKLAHTLGVLFSVRATLFHHSSTAPPLDREALVNAAILRYKINPRQVPTGALAS